MRYAEIDQSGFCFHVLDTDSEIDAPHMIGVASDAEPLGRVWNDGAWEDAPPTAPTHVDTETFLFVLHTSEQRMALRRLKELARVEAVGGEQAVITEPADLAALEDVAQWYERVGLNPQIELATCELFAPAKLLGVYGVDAEAADAEIARIQSGSPPETPPP